MLEVVAAAVRSASTPSLDLRRVTFLKQDATVTRQKTKSENSRKWRVLVDATLPVEIVVSGLKPDLVLIDFEKQHLLLGELTVALEEGIEEAHEKKFASV